MERKEFIKKFAFGGSILLTAPVLFNACSSDDEGSDGGNGNNNSNDVTVDLTQSAYSNLNEVGGFAHKGQIIIIRTGTDTYIALSNVCTHNGCKVGYDNSKTQLVCPCHNSVFTTTGSVVSGPAPTALKKYTVKKEGNILTIT